MLNDFPRLFRHNAWANQEAARSLARTPAPPPDALRRLNHILAAEMLWHGRLTGNPEAVAVWPDRSLEECIAALPEVSARWSAYLSGLTPDRLGVTVRYRNSKGEDWANTVGDILLHVLLHAAYHRGQIALILRAGGADPAYTDFIHAVRQGLVSE